MCNHVYTMEDIEKFLVDYRKVQGPKPNDSMFKIPIFGRVIWEISFFEDNKRLVFEQLYKEAIDGTFEKQQEFIKQITPILDDFYGINGIKNKIKIRKKIF